MRHWLTRDRCWNSSASAVGAEGVGRAMMPEFAAEFGQQLLEFAGGLVRLLLVLGFLAVVFWGARRLATKLNRLQRKRALYIVSIGSFIVLVVARTQLSDAVVAGGLLAAIVSLFAILTAPKW
jgi:ABC-type Co2+ transport system permease subunit